MVGQQVPHPSGYSARVYLLMFGAVDTNALGGRKQAVM